MPSNLDVAESPEAAIDDAASPDAQPNNAIDDPDIFPDRHVQLAGYVTFVTMPKLTDALFPETPGRGRPPISTFPASVPPSVAIVILNSQNIIFPILYHVPDCALYVFVPAVVAP